MAKLLEQRNLSMTPEHWAALEAAAVATNSRSTRGPQARQFSWRTLIAEIAKGNILLRVKEPYALPQGLKEAADHVEQQQRLEEARLKEERLAREKRARTDRHSCEKQTARKAPLKIEQMTMELEPA